MKNITISISLFALVLVISVLLWQKNVKVAGLQKEIEQIKQNQTIEKQIETPSPTPTLTEKPKPVYKSISTISPISTVIPVSNKTTVYVSSLSKTINCNPSGVAAINQANTAFENQQNSFNTCMANVKRQIEAQVNICAPNCSFACNGVSNFNACIDECFGNCKAQLVYDDCSSPKNDNLISLIGQYCN